MSMIYLKYQDKYILFFKAKDISKLVKKVIIDKNGNRKTVYVKINDIEKKKKQLYKFIESIRNDTTEHSLILDGSYNVILYKSDRNNKIIYTKKELREINNSFLHIHNHPNGSSFSIYDIIFFSINNIGEMRICGSIKNLKVNYYIKLKNKLSENQINSMELNYSNSEISIYKVLNDKVKAGEIDRTFASENFRHYVMIDFIKNYKENIKYEKTEG